MVGAADGFGGKLIRTVSFLGWTLPVSFLGGTGPAGMVGFLSKIVVTLKGRGGGFFVKRRRDGGGGKNQTARHYLFLILLSFLRLIRHRELNIWPDESGY